MKKFMLVALLASVLVACAVGCSPTASPATSEGTPVASAPVVSSKSIIENEDLAPGLKGVDANKNGIRDDIDRLIAKKYAATPAIKKAAEQSARSLQYFMEATTRQQALVASDEDGRALACIEKQLPYSVPGNENMASQMSKQIEALTVNTKERFTKYWNSNKLIGGGYFSQPLEPVCD